MTTCAECLYYEGRTCEEFDEAQANRGFGEMLMLTGGVCYRYPPKPDTHEARSCTVSPHRRACGEFK